ncbi:MAG: condensation domain-containing protein, partial [Mycobacterium sp.]
VPATTPGTLDWDCFSFGVIQGSDHFTFYSSVDHLNSDGMSAGPIFLDIHLRYHDLVAGRTVAAPAVGGYLDYTARQREHVANTTPASQEIQDWTTFAEDADGDWPSFPLPLGDTSTDNRGDLVTVELLTAEETEVFDMACRGAGARFSGGVMACAAMAEREFTGKTVFRGFTPSDTRTAGVDTLTAGWFASLFPVTVTMGDGTFGDAARAAQESFDANRSMASVPFERVLELTPADQLGIKLPSQPPIMVSYLDFRRIPVASLWDETNFGIYCDDLSHGGINMWINRDAERTTAAISFPDNEVARASVHRYLAALGTAFASAASTTESRPQIPARA